MSITSKDLFKWATYIGSQVAGKDQFFQEIACMTPEWRETIAYLEILKILEPNDKKLHEEIEKILKPICQKIGQAEWMPDIITHLAMKLGSIEKIYDAL